MTPKRGSYYIVAYDDTGRVVDKSAFYFKTLTQAQLAAEEIWRYGRNRIAAVKILKYRPRRNPETVATGAVATPAPAAPAAPATNPCGTRRNPRRKSMRDFIRENREELDACIHRAVPGYKLNDEDRRQWILNDEGLYNWARSEGVNV